jgi:hypothetical protein
LKKVIGLLVAAGFLLLGCTDSGPENWNESPTYTFEDKILYGTEGKFGIMKLNGESDEPEFPLNEGRHYQVYFFEPTEDFNGDQYRMTATHEEEDKAVELYEWPIDDKQSGAKFVLDKKGLWKIDVTVDDEPYTSFIVKVE